MISVCRRDTCCAPVQLRLCTWTNTPPQGHCSDGGRCLRRVAALRMKHETLRWSKQKPTPSKWLHVRRASVCVQTKLAYYVSADKTVTQSTDTSAECHSAPVWGSRIVPWRSVSQKQQSCIAGIFRSISGLNCSLQRHRRCAARCSLTGGAVFIQGGMDVISSPSTWWIINDGLTLGLTLTEQPGC